MNLISTNYHRKRLILKKKDIEVNTKTQLKKSGIIDKKNLKMVLQMKKPNQYMIPYQRQKENVNIDLNFKFYNLVNNNNSVIRKNLS